jgi:serine/threonine protein kinase
VVTTVPSALPSLNTIRPGGFFRQYQLLEQIGVGGQAVVWSALDPTRDRIYAIKFNKILDEDETRAEELGIENKLEKLIRLRHPHILPVHEYGSEERVRFMVSPYLPGGTLAVLVKTQPLSFEEVLRCGREIASALDYLHGQGVIHRDLKTSNILLDLNTHTYLADFGLARLISTSTLAFHTGHGTPPYAPPEQVRSQEITFKSDIFSFGILLFEMFTGQLPWNGKRQLGVEQLHSDEQLPDPCEYVAGLPRLITDVLRRVTSADPDLRPRSAREVMKMIEYVFNLPAESIPEEQPFDESTSRHKDAEELLRKGLAQWQASKGTFQPGLTKFVMMDLLLEKADNDVFNRFMLTQALTYGQNDHEWWIRVKHPRERLVVSAALLEKENEAIAERVLRHLLGDTEILVSENGLPQNMATALLAIGIKTNDPMLRQKIFVGLRDLLPPGKAWRDPPLAPEQIKRLGIVALEDSESGDTTAELIGHLRSPSAIQVVLRHGDEERKIDALLLIQKAAGSLPAFVPAGVRFRLSFEWILQRLTQQPLNLIAAYLLAFLGAALGVGLQVYLTYNLPNFLDIARMTTSLEQGLIIGSVLGLGFFFPRLLVERFQASNTFLRVFLATIAGGILMNIAFLIFHVLFLSTPPSGFLMTLGCLLIAFTLAVGGLMRSRLVKMLLTGVSIFIVIVGTWWIHINLATSQVEWTPMFKYDYTWPLAQVVFTALAIAFAIGIPGNLIDLTIRKESS